MFTKKTTYLLSMILCSLFSNTTQSSKPRTLGSSNLDSLQPASFQQIPSDVFPIKTYSPSPRQPLQTPSRTRLGLLRVRPPLLLANTQHQQQAAELLDQQKAIAAVKKYEEQEIQKQKTAK